MRINNHEHTDVQEYVGSSHLAPCPSSQVRINNHEHTDVQEYVGSFQPDEAGRLIFCDGALTQAVSVTRVSVIRVISAIGLIVCDGALTQAVSEQVSK